MSSWNPFTRNTTSRKSIGLITTRDFDREIRRLESLEENGKSLTRDLIKQEKSLDDFTRGQLKLLHDLSGSSFINHYDQQQTSSNISQLINDWKQTAQHISEQTNLLNEITTKTIIDSSKRLTLALANVTNAIKKREQSLNDYIKIQTKLDKLNEKLNSSTNSLSTTTQANNSTIINNNNKIEQIQKQLNEAKQQYEIKNQILTNELPVLHEQRAAFVYPCLEAFIEAQAHYCDQLEAAYRSLIGQMDVNTDNSSTLDEINAKLANIKSLSIVASE